MFDSAAEMDIVGHTLWCRLGEASEGAVATAVRDIATTKLDDDRLVFDVAARSKRSVRTTRTAGFGLAGRSSLLRWRLSRPIR
jgi:hypothetical protein